MSFILMILLLLTAGAFFGAAETALTAASKPLMHQLEDQGDPRAKTVMALLERRERLISTMLLGNILSNTAAGALTTSAMIDAFGENGVAYATGIVTVIVVVYGEILPKTYALLNANSMSLRAGGIVAALVWICRPYTIAVEFFVNGALRLAGIATEQTITAQQILAELRGTIEMQMGEKKVKEEVKHERAMLRSVLDLTGVEVGEIIIHRKKVVTIDADLPIADIIEQVAASPYSRIPLWREQPDNIVGMLHAKNLLRAIDSADGKIGRFDVVALATPPWFIPNTTKLLDQMNAFRARREHFALVVDEYGAMMGIVTLEDIIEEIVGDIRDEHDVAVPGIRPQADGGYLIDGSVTLRDLNREMEWNLPDDKASTIAGLVLHEARTIPDPGQKFLFHGFRFEVLRRQRNQLTLVRVTPPRAPSLKTNKAA